MVEFSLRLNGAVQFEHVFHNGQQKTVSRQSLMNLALALSSAFGQTLLFSVKKIALFSYQTVLIGKNYVRLPSDHWPLEQMPEHLPAIATKTLSRGDTCRRMSYAHDDNQEANDILSRRDSFSPLPGEVRKKERQWYWWLKKIIIATMWSIILVLDQKIWLATQTPPFMSVSSLYAHHCMDCTTKAVCVSKKIVQSVCLFTKCVANTIDIVIMIVYS